MASISLCCIKVVSVATHSRGTCTGVFTLVRGNTCINDTRETLRYDYWKSEDCHKLQKFERTLTVTLVLMLQYIRYLD